MPAHCGSQDCFNQLDLIDRVPEEPWTEARDIVQEAVIKTFPKKKKRKKTKQLSKEALHEVFLGLRQATLGSLDLCRGPQGASHGGSEKPGKLEVGGASRDPTGFGALEEGLISS